MEFSLNKLTLVSTLVALPISAISAPTVTFQGEVTTQTCSISINGQTNSVVMLPTVTVKDFGATLTAGQTTGLTPFTVSLSGCQKPSADTPINTNFLGYNVDADSGVLTNNGSGTGEATGFGIQLLKDTVVNSTNTIKLSGVTPVPGLVLKNDQTTASYNFGARYYVLDASGTPGKITAVAEYSINYL